MMYYIKCPDGTRWKVREAVSLKAALNEIAHARVTGSIGSSSKMTEADLNKPFNEWPTRVIASVIQVNSDNSEREPYTTLY